MTDEAKMVETPEEPDIWITREKQPEAAKKLLAAGLSFEMFFQGSPVFTNEADYAKAASVLEADEAPDPTPPQKKNGKKK